MRAKNALLSGLSTLLLLFSFALPQTGLAQQPVAERAAPRIEGFDVVPARRLSAGSELAFTLYGTAGGTASVRIGNMTKRILLDEVETGVYEGSYTIKTSDRIVATTTTTVNLRVGNQIATGMLDESLLAGARSPATRADALPGAPSGPRIDRFEVEAPARLNPGERLYFTLHGTPAGSASVRIDGVRGKFFMEEKRAGVYEGSYILRERDRLANSAKATATLRLGSREVSAALARPLLAGSGPVPPAPVASAPTPAPSAPAFCGNCGVVEAVNVVQVNGDGSYIGKIGGGVVGGLIGSQIGHGSTATAATVIGAVGGAIAGNEIEKRVKKSTHYEVVVRLQGGGAQTVTYAAQPPYKAGDRVRLENGTLVNG